MRLANAVGGLQQSAAGFSRLRKQSTQLEELFGFDPEGTLQRSQRILLGGVQAGEGRAPLARQAEACPTARSAQALSGQLSAS